LSQNGLEKVESQFEREIARESFQTKSMEDFSFIALCMRLKFESVNRYSWTDIISSASNCEKIRSVLSWGRRFMESTALHFIVLDG
jgi:hypothetical protein